MLPGEIFVAIVIESINTLDAELSCFKILEANEPIDDWTAPFLSKPLFLCIGHS